MVTMIYNLWIFLKILLIKLKSMSAEDFYSLLMECDYQQRLYAIWFRYYMWGVQWKTFTKRLISKLIAKPASIRSSKKNSIRVTTVWLNP